MPYENVDKDPDLRKRIDLGKTDMTWVQKCLTALAVLIGIAFAVLAVLLGFKAFGWITGDRFNDTQASAAGSWASAVGATALAIASVWLAMQANKQAREAEENAKFEAVKAERRHKDAIDAAERRLKSQLDAAEEQYARETHAAEDRHARELARADERLDRQIKAEWYREQARAVAALWETVGRASEPIARLADAIDNHSVAFHHLDHSDDRFKASEKAVTEAYVEWKFRIFEIRTATTVVAMLADDPRIFDYLSSLEIRVSDHHETGMRCKNEAMDEGGGAGVSNFMTDINGFMDLQWPMVKEIRRLVSSTTATQ